MHLTTGWDEGVLTVDGGMTLGEKCTLTITPYVQLLICQAIISDIDYSDYGYGAQGFPGLIPANSTLVL